VPGLFVAGELGGMGLIANAVRQGEQAVAALLAGPRARADGEALDLVIVGAGPAGIGASLAARRAGLRHLVLEQDAFGGSILHYPRKKIVMAHGLALPGRCRLPAATITKEELVALFAAVVREEALPVFEGERVIGVSRRDDGLFEVRTERRALVAARVLLAVGRRGTPRRLDVPGEELEKVAYRLLDPERIQHQHVLVVGGGDSALEAALALAESPGNRVLLAHRAEDFPRVKKKNRENLEQAEALGAVQVRRATRVREILPDRVILDTPTGEEVLPNDLVYVFAGGVLPTELLREAGLRIERHFGDRVESLP
jgi:thioredoxin reductase